MDDSHFPTNPSTKATGMTFVVDHDLMVILRFRIISDLVLSSEPDKLQRNHGLRGIYRTTRARLLSIHDGHATPPLIKAFCVPSSAFSPGSFYCKDRTLGRSHLGIIV